MSEPTQTCLLCGRRVVVNYDARGFPPKIAANKLRRACKAAGCPCEPAYRAGISTGLSRVIGQATTDTEAES